jgi:hypothetical protein
MNIEKAEKAKELVEEIKRLSKYKDLLKGKNRIFAHVAFL